jgi:hypothetical protein
MKRRLVSLSILALGGCTSISGYDAESRFECVAPKGLSCVSVSQTYKVAEAGQLPGERGSTQPEGGDARGDTSRQEGPAKRVTEPYKERRAPSVQFTTPQRACRRRHSTRRARVPRFAHRSGCCGFG